jgi:predicted MPP superfamily phosphohydrolase
MRYLFFIFFGLFLGCLLLAMHVYVWRRVVQDTELKGWVRKTCTGVVYTGIGLIAAAILLPFVFPPEYIQVFVVSGFCWLGILFYLTILLLPWDLGRAMMGAGRWFYRKRVNYEQDVEEHEHDEDRRVFVSRIAATGALMGTGIFVGVGVHGASEIETPEIEVKLARLPSQLEGFKIVQITDMHIGAILEKNFVRQVVDTVNGLNPDLIVITGDLVDAQVRHIGKDIAPLAELKARCGVYFVTGNHEYYIGTQPWLSMLDRIGVNVLLNQRAIIGDRRPGGASFDLAGLPDTQAAFFRKDHTPDLIGTLKGRDEERELILLTHRPDDIFQAAKAEVGLQISGHTHGGQMWPINVPYKLAYPYVSGLHKHGPHTQIYVSRGTGFWGPPMRVGIPAEVSSLILTQG